MILKEDNKKTDQRKLLIWIIAVFTIILVLIAFSYHLIFIYPENQVSQFGVTNVTDKANLINQYRTSSIQILTTFAQIFGGIAIGIGLYYTWRRINIAEEELKATKEGQITERFTRAIAQLGATDNEGNPAIEIRLGGIYALERTQMSLRRITGQLWKF